MSLEALNELSREAQNHADCAERLRQRAKEIANLKSFETRIKVGRPVAFHSIDAGIDSERTRFRDDSDNALKRVWKEHGERFLWLVETDLLEQARKEQMAADLLQARLDRLLAAAGSLISEEPQEASTDE